MATFTDWPLAAEWDYKAARCYVVQIPDKMVRVSPTMRSLYDSDETRGRYNGYCAFDKRPVKTESYHGILTYVPVHGGITFAQTQDDGSIVYGFDCAHAGDENSPYVNDLSWMRAEVERMVDGVLAAADFESQFENALDNEAVAAVLDAYHWHLKNEYGIDFDLRDNFGALIGALFGSLRRDPEVSP